MLTIAIAAHARRMVIVIDSLNDPKLSDSRRRLVLTATSILGNTLLLCLVFSHRAHVTNLSVAHQLHDSTVLPHLRQHLSLGVLAIITAAKCVCDTRAPHCL
jgi:hypothetical protein